jgi:hypothetical protein
MFTLWRFANHRDWKHGIFFSVALGVSQLAKYTSIFLYPLSIILFFIHDSSWLWQQLRSRSWKQLGAYFIRFLLYCSFAILVSLIIINAGFLFKNSFLPLSQFGFRSELFQEIQKTIISVMDVRLPVPQDFVQGLDVVVYKERTAFDGRASFYLLGNLNNTGFLGYYLIAYLFKTPIALLILFIIACIAYIQRTSRSKFLSDELFLIGPIIYFIIYFNLFNRFPKGIRHFMVIIPFVLIFTSSLISNWNLKVRWKRVVVIGLLFFMIVSVMSYFPHFIPYFNEFVTNRNLSYKILADSNLNWGQGQWYLDRYLEENPEAIYLPEGPTSGTVVIDPNRLLGILGDPEEYRWLREGYEPIGTIAFEYLIYQIP